MKIKTLLAFLLSITTVYFTYAMIKDDLADIKATESGELVRAELISVRCGKTSSVTFSISGKTHSKRIYVASDECAELKTKRYIDLKTLGADTMVFAKDDYNDWLEMELISSLLLGLFGLFCIYYYLIRKR